MDSERESALTHDVKMSNLLPSRGEKVAEGRMRGPFHEVAHGFNANSVLVLSDELLAEFQTGLSPRMARIAHTALAGVRV